MRYRLLALDIDGTLLTSAGTISPRTRHTLAVIEARGVAVTLATGRRLATARRHIAELGIRAPVILQGGGQIVEPGSGEMLYSNPLPPADVATAVDLLIAEGVQPILYENRTVDQHLFTGPSERDTAPMRLYLGERPDLVCRLSHDALRLVRTPLQIAAIDELGAIQRAAARLALAGCRTLISYSARLDSYFLEVFHATCSKGAALCDLSRWMGVAMEDVVAVGDNYNDREMLQMAGLGVAMANAEPEILALADHVTSSNDEDGIAALVEYLCAYGSLDRAR